MRRALLGVLVTGVCGFGLWLTSRQPTLTRTWADDHEQLVSVERQGETVQLRNVRAFSYALDSTVTRRWVDRKIRIDQADRAWYVLVPLSDAIRAPAHSFVSFGFGDSLTLSISVEGRRELGEEYSVWWGLLRSFELTYVVADESDHIGRRSVLSSRPIYRLPIKGTPDGIRAVLSDMLSRASALGTAPEFYNTAWNNCTSNLVAHVNKVTPTRLPGAIASLFPGYADDVVAQLGLVADPVPPSELRRRYRVDDLVRQAIARVIDGQGLSLEMTRATPRR
jgi:hypothetical protein